MSILKCFGLALFVALAACDNHGHARETTAAPQASSTSLKEQHCGDVMEEVNTCMDQLQDSQDAHAFNKRREEIFKGCVKDPKPECVSQMKAVDKCQAQVRTDLSLKKVREEVKGNVTRCYERFPNSRKTGGNRPSFLSGGAAGGFGGPRPGPPPFGAGPPPPPGPGFGPVDPCTPTGDEILCLKQAMDTDQNINTYGSRLREQERQCFNKPSLFDCRPDSGELRECLDLAAQAFMMQVGEKMKKCVNDAGYELPPPPPPPPHTHGFQG